MLHYILHQRIGVLNRGARIVDKQGLLDAPVFGVPRPFVARNRLDMKLGYALGAGFEIRFRA